MLRTDPSLNEESLRANPPLFEDCEAWVLADSRVLGYQRKADPVALGDHDPVEGIGVYRGQISHRKRIRDSDG